MTAQQPDANTMTLSLSRIYMPFVYRRNPALESLALTPQQNTLRDEARRLSAFLFPRVPAPQLCHFSKLVTFCFRCRDLAESCRRDEIELARLSDSLEACIDVFRTGQLPKQPQPLHRFALEVQQELKSLQTPAQQHRLTQAIADHLLRGTLAVLQLELTAKAPTIRIYREVRRFDVALHVLIELCELADDIQLPASVAEHPVLRRMRREACLQIALANDILANGKTVNEDPLRSSCNMVDIIAHQNQIGREQATLEVVEMVNHHMWNFIDLERKLPRWSSEINASVKRYLQAIKNLMGGNWYWSLEEPGFQSPTSAFTELRHTLNLEIPPRRHPKKVRTARREILPSPFQELSPARTS